MCRNAHLTTECGSEGSGDEEEVGGRGGDHREWGPSQVVLRNLIRSRINKQGQILFPVALGLIRSHRQHVEFDMWEEEPLLEEEIVRMPPVPVIRALQHSLMESCSEATLRLFGESALLQSIVNSI